MWWFALVAAWWTGSRIGTRRAARLTALAAIGGALPLLAAWAGFAWLGAAREFLYWNVTHNLGYAQNSIGLDEALGRAVRYAVPFALVVAPLAYATRRSWPRFIDPYERVLLAGLFITTGVAAALGLRFYPHYFIQFYVPLALGSAPWLVAAGATEHRGPWRIATYAIAILVVSTMANAVLYFGPWPVYRERLPVYRDFARWQATDSCAAGASLFVWGYAPSFYYESGLPPASRFLFVESTLTGYVPGRRASRWPAADTAPLGRADHWSMLLQDLERNRATYIVDTSRAARLRWQSFGAEKVPILAAYLARQYDALQAIDTVVVYRRKGCSDASRLVSRIGRQRVIGSVTTN